jgi:hypothetical protein
MGRTWRHGALLGAVAAAVVVGAVGALGATAVSPTRARADRAAAEVLPRVRAPAGAHAVALPPRGTSANIFVPVPLGHGVFGSPYLVDRHRYFVVPGTAQGVASWMVAHPPQGWHGTVFNGRCRAAVVGARCLLSFERGDTGIYKGLDPALLVKAIQIAGRRTVVRVDTDLAWFGPRDRFDSIPAGATVLTIAPLVRGHPAVRAIRDRATIDAFVSELAALRAFPPNAVCPADLVEPTYLYAFKVTAAAAPVAEVAVNLSGCTTVDVEVHGLPGAELVGSAAFDGHLP